MADKREYRLKINAFSPETMPMKRLAEYLADMAVLLGEESHVHLIGIESSSTCPVVLVDWEAEPKVIDRVQKARNAEGPEDAQRAIENINARLRRDNASADLISPSQSRILEFPGIRIEQPIEWPSINQAAELYGIPIWVGGRAELSNVDLLDGNAEWKCLTERAKAIAIAPHIYRGTLRVFGRGRWRKTPAGPWDLERFVIEDFEVVRVTSIEQTIEELRAVNAKWKTLSDPLAALDAIRSGEDKDADGSIR
jgi:hypothetical protein